MRNLFVKILFFLLPWQTGYIFYVPMVQGSALHFGVGAIYATQVLLIAGVVAVILREGLPKYPPLSRKIAALALGIFAVAALSLARTPDILSGFSCLWNLICAGLLFMFLLDPQTNVEQGLKWFVYGLIPVALLGVCQVFFGFSPASSWLGLAAHNAATRGDSVLVFFDHRILRAYGTFPHPNILGGYLAVGLLAVKQYIPRKSRAACAACILLLGLLVSASRSAMLGLALGAFLVWFVTRAKNVAKARIQVIPIALGVIGVALALTYATPSFTALSRGGGVTEVWSLQERRLQVANWWQGMHGVDWLVGHGLSSSVLGSTFSTQPIHNLPLLIIFELGFIGAIIIVTWSSTIDKLNFSRFPHPGALLAFGMGNVVLVILFFDHYLWTLWPGLALIAFVMALTVRLGEDESTPPRSVLSQTNTAR
jgi:Ca2+/Na+ antiporter